MATVFVVTPPAGLSEFVYGVVLTLLIAGVVLALSSFKVGKERRAKLLVVGVIFLVAGAGVYFVTSPTQQDSITVNSGFIQVSTSQFDIQVPVAQIAHAYVVNLSDWNVSISSRTDGSAFGSYRSGYFALSNGAKAEVLTTGDANLVLVLNSGTYVILGPSDFQAFTNSFTQNVLRLPFP